MSLCVDAVKLFFQIAPPPTAFLWFSRNLARMIYVSIRKIGGTDFWYFDFKIFGDFLKQILNLDIVSGTAAAEI